MDKGSLRALMTKQGDALADSDISLAHGHAKLFAMSGKDTDQELVSCSYHERLPCKLLQAETCSR